MRLRDYQQDLIDRTRQALQAHRRVILQAPTGAGKTALTVSMIAGAAAKGVECLFVVHRHELLAQTSAALWDQGVQHGVIASGRRPSGYPVNVASIQTLDRRIKAGQAPSPGLIVIDEAHRSVASTYARMLESMPEAFVVGLTATPARTDGKGLDDLYSDIVTGPSVRDLIEAGYLADYSLYAPPETVTQQKMRVRQGDFVRGDAEQAMDKPAIIGDAVEHYHKACREHERRLRAVVFCVGRQHAYHTAEAYRDAGINAMAITGETHSSARRIGIKDFREGRLDVLVGVDLFIEGLDVPGAEVAQILRPTQSLIVHMQAIGRVLRPKADGSKAIILDHVGNTWRHGLPDDEREWALAGIGQKDDGDSVPAPKRCEKCHAVYPAHYQRCPECSHAPEAQSREGPEEVSGELSEVDVEKRRAERRKQIGQARTLDRLVEVALANGYKPSWAGITYHSRNGGDKGRLIQHAKDLAKSKRAQRQAPTGVV
jgi:superfamily II DNA or RNA helicase